MKPPTATKLMKLAVSLKTKFPDICGCRANLYIVIIEESSSTNVQTFELVFSYRLPDALCRLRIWFINFVFIHY